IASARNLVVRFEDDARTFRLRNLRCAIGRVVVAHNDFEPGLSCLRKALLNALTGLGDQCLLVERGDEHTDERRSAGGRVGHDWEGACSLTLNAQLSTLKLPP